MSGNDLKTLVDYICIYVHLQMENKYTNIHVCIFSIAPRITPGRIEGAPRNAPWGLAGGPLGKTARAGMGSGVSLGFPSVPGGILWLSEVPQGPWEVVGGSWDPPGRL